MFIGFTQPPWKNYARNCPDMKTTEETNTCQLSPQLSALEASLASLEPLTQPGSREDAKSAILLRLLESPSLSGEKLIETIVRSDDQEITLSLKEYVKATRFSAGLYGTIFGILGGLLLGLLVGISVSAFLFQPVQTPLPVREIHHIPYFVNGSFDESRLETK